MSIDTPHWVSDAVFYQVFPDRFAASTQVPAPGPFEPWDAPPTRNGFKGGNLPGITERLPYLADLGITALYLSPIFTSASNHRYHTFDYFSVDPLLGGDAALRELLDAAHGRGMRVILDGVFNHTGRGFWAFHHVLENGAASPYRDWFHVDLRRLAAGRPLIAYPEVLPAGFAWEEAGAWDTTSDEPHGSGPGSGSFGRLGYRAWWDLPALPKLNTSNPEVREHLLSVAEHWLRFGIDGWRLDVPTEIDDPSFWAEFRRRCRAANPEAYLVGEIWGEAPDWLAGDRFDAVMNYPLGTAILAFVAGARMDPGILTFHHAYRGLRPLDAPAFAIELERILSLYDPAVTRVQLNLIGSHDTPRFLTLAGGDERSLRLATFLQMVMPGAPCIYYGDEVGLAGGADPANRGSFPRDESMWNAELQSFFRATIALRGTLPALRGEHVSRLGAEGGCLALLRSDGASTREATSTGGAGSAGSAGGVAVVALNVDDVGRDLVLDAPEIEGRTLRPVLLPGWEDVRLSASGPGASRLHIGPRSGVVLIFG
jgi:neopullulanase